MPFKLTPIILIIVFLLGLTLASAQETPEAPPVHYRTARTIAVWLPYWLDKDGTGAGWRSIQNHAGLIDEVSFFAFAADPKTGTLTAEGDGHGMNAQTVVTQVGWLHTRQIAALATITQFNHVGEMLSDQSRLDLLVQHIVALTETYGFDGVDIDFEDFKKGDPDDAGRYTAFLTALAAALHARPDSFGFPRIVVATVLAQTERGSFAFTDYTALANSPIDRIRVMAYDDHYAGSKQAGACAPAPWVGQVAAYINSLDAPTWKFVLGVPGYAYGYPVTSNADLTTTGHGISVTYGKAMSLMQTHTTTRQWDAQSGTPYFNYQDDGKRWMDFYEDAQSWEVKVQTVLLPSRLNGLAEWAVGYEDPHAWPMLGDRLGTRAGIYGVVGNCYWRFGGGARFGSPKSAEADAGPSVPGTLNGREGRQQGFEYGRIFYRWGDPRAHYLDGALLMAYDAQGGCEGQMGFPVSDPEPQPDGRRKVDFENGSLTM